MEIQRYRDRVWVIWRYRNTETECELYGNTEIQRQCVSFMEIQRYRDRVWVIWRYGDTETEFEFDGDTEIER